jgi:hypothetical protein
MLFFDVVNLPCSRITHTNFTINYFHNVCIFITQNSYMFRPYILSIFTDCLYIYYTKFLHVSAIYPGHLHGVFVYLLYKIPTCSAIYPVHLHGVFLYLLYKIPTCSAIYPGHLQGVFVYLLHKIPTRFDLISWPSSDYLKTARLYGGNS